MEQKSRFILIASILGSLLLGFYIGYISVVKNHGGSDNIYENKDSYADKVDDDYLTPLFVYEKKPYFFIDVPKPIKKQLIRERLQYYKKINEVLKTLVIQYEDGKEKDPEKFKSFKKLPDLVSFYSYMVTDKEVKKIYEDNKEKFGKGHNPEQTMFEIHVKLLSKRILSYTQKKSSEIVSKDKYYFQNRDPFLPLEWLEFPLSPTLSDGKEKDIRIHIFLNYTCDDCMKLSNEVREVFESFDRDKLTVSLLHSSETHLDTTYYTNKSALCVHDQNKDVFWKYHDELLSRNKELRLLRPLDLDAALEIFITTLNKDVFKLIDQKKFRACLKDEHVDKEKGTKSKITGHLQYLKNEFDFLNFLPYPIVLINGRRLENAFTISEGIKLGLKEGWFQIK